MLNDPNIWFDYAGKSVDILQINGKIVPAEEYIFSDCRIYLPTAYLNLNQENTVMIKFSNNYYHDGNGLHSFADIDGSQYLYIQSEPFWGNRVCPLFDQPDIKARYTLHVTAPPAWTVITSEEQNVTMPYTDFLASNKLNPFYDYLREHYGSGKVDQSYQFRQFNQTKILSTYLHNFIAGPYHKIVLPEEKRHKNIPMTIYCRNTLKKFVEDEASNLFAFHIESIRHYEEMFSYDYPFCKCDAIFCPEFTVGAMEYPGSITYSEMLLPKEKSSLTQKSRRSKTIVHEMAHMWFGNTVTMKWWNDLWLNESFADYMAYTCLYNVHKNNPTGDLKCLDGRLMFLIRKEWGYTADERSTTHAIRSEVVDTGVADSIFDGITYSKGAAVLYTFFTFIGQDIFKAAMKEYFQTYQWKNTTLMDLLEIFEKKIDTMVENKLPHHDVKIWMKDWIETPGLNVMTVEEWSEGADSITITQTSYLEQFAQLRYHYFKIGCYDQNCKLIKVIEVHLDKAETNIIKLDDDVKGKACAF